MRVALRARMRSAAVLACFVISACDTTRPPLERTAVPVPTRLGDEGAITRAASLEALDDGDVVVVGNTNWDLDPEGRRGAIDALVARVALDGTLVWARQLGQAAAPISLVVKAWDVALHPNGDVIVAGLVNGRPSFEGEPLVSTFTGFVASFDADTGERGFLTLMADASGGTELMGVEVLPNGEIVVAGYTSTSTLGGAPALGLGDTVLAWIADDGAIIRVRRYGSTEEEYPSAFGRSGDTLFVATNRVSGDLGQVLGVELLGIDDDGDVVARRVLDDPARTLVTSLASHPDGICAAFALRTFDPTAGSGADHALGCYDRALEPLGFARGGTPGGFAGASGVACDATGACTLTGTADVLFDGEPIGDTRRAFAVELTPDFAIARARVFGTDDLEESAYTRGTAIVHGVSGFTIAGDVSGSLFGERAGYTDVYVVSTRALP